jgi:GPH family glycoside/pentoside/hexuronide:cation symporter
MKPANRQREEISFKTNLFFALSNMGIATISGTYGSLLTIFYQDYIGLSARWIGIASAVYAVWNAINDPIFGFMSDNTRSKMGRRIPYLRFTAPFLALTFFLVWMVPESASEIVQFWWMLVMMLLYDSAFTIVGLNNIALLPEIAETDEGRTTMQVYAGLAGLLATALGFMIPEFFRPRAGVEVSLVGLKIAMGVLGLVSSGLIIAASFVLREKPAISQSARPMGLWKSMMETFKSKSFVIWVIENFMSTFSMAIVTGSIFYLADYVTQSGTLTLLAAVFLPMIVGMIVSKPLVSRIGGAHAVQLYLGIGAVGLISLTFVPSTALIYVCLGVAGIGLGGTATLNTICVGQIADEDELRTGDRREGSFFGVNALVTKPSQSLAIFLTAWILEISGFVTREQNLGQIFLNQSDTALLGIRSIVGLLPGVAMVIGIVVLIFYPLKGEYMDEVREQVQALHRQKEAQYHLAQLGSQPEE